MTLAFRIPMEEKLEIVKDSLLEWKLLDNMFPKIGSKVGFEDDLQRYVEYLKATIYEMLLDY